MNQATRLFHTAETAALDLAGKGASGTGEGACARALIVVDMQNDFMEGGALPVTGARALVPVINALARRFELVIGTQDWHPADHASFAPNHPGRAVGERMILDGLDQVMWPVHCVQETPGAEFVAGLEHGRWATVFRKGTDPRVDSYSGFYDNARRRDTGLGAYLQARGVEEVFVVGVATDYCVAFTAQDALSLGLRTIVIADACRGVNLQPGDDANALEELREMGAQVVGAAEVLHR